MRSKNVRMLRTFSGSGRKLAGDWNSIAVAERSCAHSTERRQPSATAAVSRKTSPAGQANTQAPLIAPAAASRNDVISSEFSTTEPQRSDEISEPELVVRIEVSFGKAARPRVGERQQVHSEQELTSSVRWKGHHLSISPTCSRSLQAGASAFAVASGKNRARGSPLDAMNPW